MNKITIPLFFFSILFINAQHTMSSSTETPVAQPKNTIGNPLFNKSSLPYEAPPFDLIKNEHFKPAFVEGLKINEAEIKQITENPKPATFENTVVALEKSGELLKRAQAVFYNLTSANTNAELQKLQTEFAPIFSAHNDKIYLNEKLYQRFKAIDASALKGERLRILNHYIQNFEIAGANLSPQKREEMKEINQQLAVLTTEFNTKLLEARKNSALVLENVKLLDGLSTDQIEAAAQDAKAAGEDGKYLIALQNTTQQPWLQNLKNRKTREALFQASWLRAEKNNEDDTRNSIEKIVRLRLKKAQLLGKKNFAEWKLQDQMAKTPEAAIKLMQQIAKPAVETAAREQKDIQDLIFSQKETFKTEAWDWNYYAEQVRKAKFDLDDNEIKPYFEVTTVLEKGVFYAAEKFYGLTFKKRPDLPVYHPDVVAYEVFDHDGSSLAIYYLDFFTRPSKKGGAWMSSFVKQSHLLGQKPVIVNCFNYQKPAPGKPSLISFDDVETMFHEFGHSIHGMFANQEFPTLSGTAVPRDFVEFPSQINEHWALDPLILKNYALHFETKKEIPQDLVQKIKKSTFFNTGYNTVELVSAAMLDMDWHTVSQENGFSPVLDFEKTSLQKNGFTLYAVPPRYHSPYFAHVFGGGYSAGYYAYLWAETLDSDAWEWISTHGGLTRENGDRFRKYILSVGNSVDLGQAFRAFTGHDPDIKPLLRSRGFIK